MKARRPLSILCLTLVTLGTAACGPPPPRCTPATCDGGCCTADDVCVAGTAPAACGAGGSVCVACAAAEVCAQNTCTAQGIVAPEETWTWVGFPESRCANGTSTGIGVNLTSRSTDVLVYLQGGGACWDTLTCVVLGTATAFGYTQSTFASEPIVTQQLTRAEPTNPFGELSYVFVPYCTADVHAGDAQQAYNPLQPSQLTQHRGKANLSAYLVRLRDTFPRARRVFLAGSSAGGYGAQLNYPLVAAAFPGAEVHLLADSAQMVNPVAGRLAQWTAAWNVVAPQGCPECATDFRAYPRWLAGAYPGRRFGLLAFEQDPVLALFFNGSVDPSVFRAPTRALIDATYRTGNARAFVLPDQDHAMLDRLYTLGGPGGVSLRTWVEQWVEGSPAWETVAP